jgi:hypothetical protein
LPFIAGLIQIKLLIVESSTTPHRKSGAKAPSFLTGLFLFLHLDHLSPFVSATMRTDVVREQGFMALRAQGKIRSI